MKQQVKTAFLSDIHANFEALQSVLRDLDAKEVHHLASLGDVVGYGGNPNECLDLIRTRCRYSVCGNHETALLKDEVASMYRFEIRNSLEFHKSILSTENLNYIGSLSLLIEEPNFTATHGSLHKPTEFEYVFTKQDAQRHFANQKTRIAFCAHTHTPGIWIQQKGRATFTTGKNIILKDSGKYLINVGSVGQPRDGDARACYVIFDPTQQHVEFFRVSYDVKKAAEAVLQCGGSPSFASRLFLGR
jgi:diadenosine tetraphosphatase ApaH/serine/threonine PP2A family protein phosphatase